MYTLCILNGYVVQMDYTLFIKKLQFERYGSRMIDFMTDTEKAMLILEKLDNVLSVNWNMENLYISAIVSALKEIDQKDQKG